MQTPGGPQPMQSPALWQPRLKSPACPLMPQRSPPARCDTQRDAAPRTITDMRAPAPMGFIPSYLGGQCGRNAEMNHSRFQRALPWPAEQTATDAHPSRTPPPTAPPRNSHPRARMHSRTQPPTRAHAGLGSRQRDRKQQPAQCGMGPKRPGGNGGLWGAAPRAVCRELQRRQLADERVAPEVCQVATPCNTLQRSR